MATRTILIAEPVEAELHNNLSQLTLQFEATFSHCLSGSTLFQEISTACPEIIVIDLDLFADEQAKAEEDHLKLLHQLKKEFNSVTILPVIPEKKPQLIKDILTLDIYYSLHKPLDPAETAATLNRIVATLPEIEALPQTETTGSSVLPTTEVPDFHGMTGISQIMRDLFEMIKKVAADDLSTVLIRGESGTGKEMVAKAIHRQSSRANNNFVPVNCAAIPDDLLESELFGYTKGAFTGANTNKPGRIQFADKGTLFLDEIGDMKHSLQAKLLRVIQEREFEPVGAFKSTPVNTRILAATHCNLEELVNEGKFREDLYYRLSVVPIHIPALRERPEDIPYLVNNFLKKYAAQKGRESFSFSSEALATIIHYPWRGNVRELENLIQQLTILYSGKRVERKDLPEKFHDVTIPEDFSFNYDKDLPQEEEISGQENLFVGDMDWGNGIDFNELINNFETQLIIKAMRQTEGNKKEAARLLNLKRTTLLEKIKKKEINGLWEK